MFADGEGRKDAATARMSGPGPGQPAGARRACPTTRAQRPRPGDLADVVVTYAAPHHLNADAGLTNLRRTRGGDAWAARRAGPARCRGQPRAAVVGVPDPLPAASACSIG